MKKVIVEKCDTGECPFSYFSFPIFYCTHPSVIEKEIGLVDGVEIPEWCPLRKEPVTIELKK